MAKNGQNKSSAVMAQRVEPEESFEYFPTPPFATRMFCEYLFTHGMGMKMDTVLEPACGQGHMARALGEYFRSENITATDILDFGYGEGERDFLIDGPPEPMYDWCITNPPFSIGVDFILKMLLHARRGVAVLVRQGFLESETRYRNLFENCPPSLILQNTARVPMWKGRTTAKGGTATSYIWLIWKSNWKPLEQTRYVFLPPTRYKFEREWDYRDPSEWAVREPSKSALKVIWNPSWEDDLDEEENPNLSLFEEG